MGCSQNMRNIYDNRPDLRKNSHYINDNYPPPPLKVGSRRAHRCPNNINFPCLAVKMKTVLCFFNWGKFLEADGRVAGLSRAFISKE